MGRKVFKGYFVDRPFADYGDCDLIGAHIAVNRENSNISMSAISVKVALSRGEQLVTSFTNATNSWASLRLGLYFTAKVYLFSRS